MSRLVNRATSDDRENTQGFLLRELSQATLKSIDDCQSIEDALVKKLKRDRPNIKRKSLKCIKYICEHGNNSFQINFQRHSQIIRDCAQYRGTPDPVYGDAPYEEVRQAAKECMDSIFRTTNMAEANHLRSRIKGMQGGGDGSSMGNGSYGGSSSSMNSGKMPGFGSHSYTPSRAEEKSTASKVWNSVWSSVSGSGKNEPKADPYANNHSTYTGPSGASSSGGSGSNSYSGSGSNSYSGSGSNSYSGSGSNSYSVNHMSSSGFGSRKVGSVGGVWGSNPTSTASTVDDDDDDTPKNSFGGKITTKASTGELEERIVESATQPRGVKAKPTEKELNKFVEEYRSLDQDKIADLLANKLECGTWQEQLRSLSLVEAVLKSGAGENMEEFLQDNSDLLENLLEVKKRTIKAKARAVAKLAGLKDLASKGNSKKKSVGLPVYSNPTPTPQPNLVNIQPTPVVEQPKKEAVPDLLGLGSFETAPVVTKPEPTTNSMNMFENLDVKNDNNDSTDIFSLGPTPQTNNNQHQPQNSMFMGMNTEPTDVQKADPTKTQQPADNPFSFITPTQKPNDLSTFMNPTASAANKTQTSTGNNFPITTQQPSSSPGFNLFPNNTFQQPANDFQQPTYTFQQPNNTHLIGFQQPNAFNHQNSFQPKPFQTNPMFQPTGSMQPNSFPNSSNFGNSPQMNFIQPNQTFGTHVNSNFGPKPSPGFGTGNSFNNYGKRNSHPASGKVDPFANLMTTGKKKQHKTSSVDAFADLVKL